MFSIFHYQLVHGEFLILKSTATEISFASSWGSFLIYVIIFVSLQWYTLNVKTGLGHHTLTVSVLMICLLTN